MCTTFMVVKMVALPPMQMEQTEQRNQQYPQVMNHRSELCLLWQLHLFLLVDMCL